MPSKTKPKRKAPNGQSKKSETVTIRLRPELRRDLEKSAEKRGNSLNHEISVRLQGSLTTENAFGGAKLTELAHLMAARFIAGGHQAGESLFGPEVAEEKWLANPYCYDNGLLALLDALWARRPNRTRESDAEMFNRLQGRISARWESERVAR